MISLSVSVLSLFLELLSWPLADLDKTLSRSVKDRIIRSSSAVDLANGMSPSYSSYASPKRRSPQMAGASRMMPGATYSLRKNSVCSVFSSRCVMAVSHSKKGVCHLSTACHGWDHFISFTQGGFNEKRNSILSCMLFKGEKIFKIILKKGICMESSIFIALGD